MTRTVRGTDNKDTIREEIMEDKESGISDVPKHLGSISLWPLWKTIPAEEAEVWLVRPVPESSTLEGQRLELCLEQRWQGPKGPQVMGTGCPSMGML